MPVINPINHPVLVFVVSFAALIFSVWFGGYFRRRRTQEGDAREYGVVETATLTLLALIVGFTFSMAIDRFNQRKQCEAVEANTIGTEYLRLSLLPATETSKLQAMMQEYVDLRIAFYVTRDHDELGLINARTSQLQSRMWSTVSTAASALPPSPLVGLAVSGMNEALDAQGYTQAAWLNRIPVEGWGLMLAIGIFCNLLLGYTSRSFEKERPLLLVMPLILSVSFFLIADIDSPRWGLIHVRPANLDTLAVALHTPALKP